jgi:type IV secretion system protein VirB10
MDDQMAPDASPSTLSKSKNGGVRRVNNLPIYFVMAAFGAFVVMMALVAVDRAAKQNAEVEALNKPTGQASNFAEEIAGDKVGGLVVPDLPPSPPHVPPVLIAKPENLDAPPTPPRMNTPPMQDEEAQRIKMMKFQQLEEATRARTGVQTTAPRSNASPPVGRPQNRTDLLAARISDARQQAETLRATDPTAAYQARIEQIRGMGIGGAGRTPVAASQLLPTANTNTGTRNESTGNDVGRFSNTSGDDRWRLDSQPEAPRSAYELRAGFVVPGTLISGINSDLPGQIMAQVSQHVYDTPTGKHLLIPLGSRLVGSYSSDVKYGQARVLVAWQRIVFPDGKAMDIGAMPGADGAGYAGFNDQVNHHYLRLFGSAFLMSGITAGITYTQRQNRTQTMYGAPSASTAMSEALGQQLGQVTAQLIAKNMSIAPTLEIRPGYRFNIVVIKDMTFSKPYQSFDY